MVATWPTGLQARKSKETKLNCDRVSHPQRNQAVWTCLRRLTLKQRFPCFIALCFFLVLFPDVDSVKAFYPINVPLNHCHQSVIPRSAIEVVRSACQKLNRAEPLPCFQMNTPDLGQRMGALEVFLLPPKISPYLVGKIWRLISWAPQPASISRLLRAASNFHEQNWHKTYHPFPNFFCFARRSVYVGYLLHSKLLTRKWPSQHSLLRRTESPMQIGRLGRSWTNALLIHVVRYRVQVLLVGMRSRYHKSSRCFTADEVNGAYCLTSC